MVIFYAGHTASPHSASGLHFHLHPETINLSEKVRACFGQKVVCDLGLEGRVGDHLVVSQATGKCF